MQNVQGLTTVNYVIYCIFISPYLFLLPSYFMCINMNKCFLSDFFNKNDKFDPVRLTHLKARLRSHRPFHTTLSFTIYLALGFASLMGLSFFISLNFMLRFCRKR